MSLVHRRLAKELAALGGAQIGEDALDVLEGHLVDVLEVATVEAEREGRRRVTAAMLWRCIGGVK